MRQYKPDCDLKGTRGNTFQILAKVKLALEAEELTDRAKEWMRRAPLLKDAAAVRALADKFVNVTSED